VFGLGNPGPRYAGTRHNVGFRVLEVLVRRAHAEPGPSAAEYRWWRATFGAEAAALVAPQTYMNESGRALGAWRERMDLEPGELLVVADDVYLPLGVLRVRERGSSGGHRGLESIEAVLGTREHARSRVGVGAAESGAALREHVLEELGGEELEVFDAAIQRAAEVVECWIGEGVKVAMNRYNQKVTKEVSEP